MPLARLAWLVCAALLLAGCSVVKLGYRSADTLTLRWLNRYADLDTTQDAWARERVSAFYVWHRATQLPDYARWLQRTRELLQSAVTREDMLALNADVSARLNAVAAKALPDLATLALQLHPAQIAHIGKEFEQNNADFRKDFLDPRVEERQQTRYETVLWLAEVLFGRFSAEQEAVIRRASDARPLMNELWLEERIERQRDLLAVLRRIRADKAPQDVVVKLLEPHTTRATGIAHIPDPQLRTQAQTAAEHAAQLAATIVNLATPEQRQRAMTKLQQWADDFRDLSVEPG